VMRAARTAVNEGLLKRKENGVYAITKKGVKAVA
jgi:predicted transcriptional regulator